MYFIIFFLLPLAFLPIYHYQAEIIKIAIFLISFFVYFLKTREVNIKRFFFLCIPFFFSYAISLRFIYFDSHFLFFHFITAIIFIFIFDAKKEHFLDKNKYLAYSAIIVSIFGLINYYGYNNLFMPIGTSFSRGMLKSTIGNTNFTADFLATSLPLLIFGFFNEKQKSKSVIFWIAGTLSAFVILLCQTRSILFGVFVSLLLFSVSFIISNNTQAKEKRIKINSKKTLLLLLSLMISFALFFSPPWYPEEKDTPFEQLIGRVSAVIIDDIDVDPAYKRELEWKTAYNMFLEKPVFGHGWGTFKLLSPDFQLEITSKDQKFYGYYQRDFRAHSDWLQLLAEGGILAFSSFMLIVLIIFVEAVKKILSRDYLALAVFCSWLIIIFHSFVEFPLNMEPSLSMFALLSAYLVKDLPKKFISQKQKNIFLLLYVFVLYIAMRFFISDITCSISNYQRERTEFQIENISENEYEKYKATEMFEDVMNQMFFADLSLSMNKNHSHSIFNLTSGLNFANNFDEFDQSILTTSFSPFGLYKRINSSLLEYRMPPQKIPVIPENVYIYGLDLNYLIMRIAMNELNTHMDSYAILRLAKTQKVILSAFIQTNISDEELFVWKEWMKYSYRLALKMRGRDSSDWYCIDIEFLNALADIEGITKEFEDEFIFRLQHREKLIEYGIDDDLPALWYDFYDQNISCLSTEQRELADGLMLKIQRMVNENQK